MQEIITRTETTPKKNPTGPSLGEKRVYRGGGWIDEPISLRIASRDGVPPEFRDANLGVRCAADIK
jgi:formylglycine-generating enzyme required for sulfatase activity